MSDDVREIKSRMDITELVGDYVQLRRMGSSLKGLCPFHSEKTPSFTVSSDRQTFHCFGCGKGGDVFTFLMEIEGLSFREALEQLAQRTGVKLSHETSPVNAAKRKETALILEEAEKFFKDSLLGTGGEAPRLYLERRGLAREDWLRFGIGWGPRSWDALLTHMRKAGFTDSDIVNSGLAGQGEKGLYDRFRGRVIFPVRDEMGKIRGFGGRLIDGEGAKYVNSPEGELFNKRRLLYLMHAAKKTVRELGRVILTEGYMDAIRCHLAGFSEAVASLGTSLTEEQASLIKRFADLCYIVYDSDSAGQEAAVRGMYILQRRGVEVRVVSISEGKDPDELLSGEDGGELFRSLLKKALPLPLYHVFIRRHALRMPGKGKAAREDVLNGLASLSALDIQAYIPKIAEGFGVLQHQVEREIELRRRKAENAKSAIYEEGNEGDPGVYIDSGENIEEESLKSRETDLECAVCSIIWHDEELRSRLSQGDVVPFLTDEAVAGAVSALLSGESPDELESRWRALGETGCPGRIARGDAVLAEGLGPDDAPKMIETLRKRALTRRYDELTGRCLRGEATKDEIAEKDDLAKKIKGNVGA